MSYRVVTLNDEGAVDVAGPFDHDEARTAMRRADGPSAIVDARGVILAVRASVTAVQRQILAAAARALPAKPAPAPAPAPVRAESPADDLGAEDRATPVESSPAVPSRPEPSGDGSSRPAPSPEVQRRRHPRVRRTRIAASTEPAPTATPATPATAPSRAPSRPAGRAPAPLRAPSARPLRRFVAPLLAMVARLAHAFAPARRSR